MRPPTISQYIESLQAPHGLFRTLPEFEPELDAYGGISIRSGNNAVVFKLHPKGDPAAVPLALKCYIKHGPHRDKIYAYLQRHPSPLWPPTRLLRGEVYVYDYDDSGAYYDAAVSDWVEGETLETVIRRAAQTGNREKLAALAASFDRLALQLLDAEWAHGDLKPDNIMHTPAGDLVLIDHDAMFIPELAGERTVEIGTPHYQHPARDARFFNRHIDDYSIAVISASLHALSLDPRLYDRYNNSDNIILTPSDIFRGDPPAYTDVLALASDAGAHGLLRLAQMLRSPSPTLKHLADTLRILTPAHTADETVRESGPPSLFCREGRWGFRDGKGRTVVEPIYDDAAEFSEGMAAVCIGGVWYYIDRAGNPVIRCDGYQEVQSFSEGMAAVKSNGLWGYVDRAGNELIPPQFESASAMREEAAAVKQSGAYGFIDRTGAWIAKPQYSYATGFRNGAAQVEQGGEAFLIDKSGRFLRASRDL